MNCRRNCPITSIEILDNGEMEFIRDPHAQSIVDLLVHPDFPCFNRWK
jgi:hypothetical protein